MTSLLRKKLVIIGDGAVGKTSLLHAYFKDEFLELYDATVLETYVKEIDIDGKKCEINVWDTAGQEDYEKLRPLAYPESNVVLMCYCIDAPDSLTNISDKWNPEVKYYCPQTPVVLCGNKKDLRHDEAAIEQLRKQHQEVVTPEQGKSMARRIGAHAFFECSAKTKEGIKDVFNEAVRAALLYTPEKKGKRNKKCKML